MTRGVAVPLAPGAHGAVHHIDPSFPRLMEDRLILLVHHGPHPMHSTHVMHAIHGRPPCGEGTFATPTMESRVTSAASSSSVRFSVPAGRSGSTRYRRSAVLSQTRTSTSSASW